MAEMDTEYTPEERRAIETVKEYIRIAYDPQRANAGAVAHLCGSDNKFIAPTTFPGVNTLEEYAEAHAELMRQLSDIRLVNFDVIFADGGRVCARYTAEGTHSGEPHGDIQPTGRKARWTSAAIFLVRNGKLVEFIKEWNKLSMWEQLGWPIEECLERRQRGAG